MAGVIDLQVADARKLSFPDGAFDAGYSSFTLELFLEEDVAKVLAAVSPSRRWRK